MKLKEILEKLEQLLKGWGLTKEDWVFSGEYAWRLQNYKFKPRKGHLDIFVDRKKLPWRVGKEDATAIPPKNSKELKQLKKFIKKTGFHLHLLPLPIGGAEWQDIERTRGQSEIYTLPNGEKIRIHKVSELIQDRANILLKVGIKSWSRSKIERWLNDFKTFKKCAKKKGEEEVVKICNFALKQCEEIEEKPQPEPPPKEVPSGVSEIKGNVAYKGRADSSGTCLGLPPAPAAKVKGRIRIISSAEGLSKLKKGEILVTPMTSPDFVIAIEKAKAIVTDKGGIGCHAAVISREFEIPCIIGTKIATQVLNDGDKVEVEVDAKKGIVKILEKVK